MTGYISTFFQTGGDAIGSRHWRTLAITAGGFVTTAFALLYGGAMLPSSLSAWLTESPSVLFGLLLGFATIGGWRALLIGAVSWPVYHLASWIAQQLSAPLEPRAPLWVACLCAGLAGGLLMTAALGVMARDFLRGRCIARGACAGAVGGLMLGLLWGSDFGVIVGFVTWQVLVGCTLVDYSMRRRSESKRDWRVIGAVALMSVALAVAGMLAGRG